MPQPGRRSDYVILAVLGIIAVIVVVLVTSSGWRPREPESYPARTTYSTRPNGTMACYLLFERFDIDVRRSERPLLDETLKKCDVVVLLDPLVPIEDGERIALRSWVRSGGVLVYSRSRYAFVRSLGSPDDDTREHTRSTRPARATTAHRAPAAPLPLARDVSATRFDTYDTVELDDYGPLEGDREGTALFADEAGTRIVSHRIGRGAVIVLADSSFLTNKYFGDEDNAVLAANLVEYALAHAQGARVAFDEYHVGFGRRASGFSLLRTSLVRTTPGWSMLCLMTAGVLFLVYQGRRFGTRYPPTRVRRRTKLEYVRSVGATYRSARAHGLTFELIYGWFRRTLTAAVGLPPSAPVDVLAAAIARRTLHGPHHYEQILAECETALAQRRLRARRARALLDKLASIESEVVHGHRTRK